jgi:hypothetical protein
LSIQIIDSISIIKVINEMKSTAKILVITMALGTPLVFSHTLLAASDATSNPAEPPASMGMAMMPMQQQMRGMQEQMAKMHATTNPEERRALMREHANTMQGMMKMMHGMMAGQGMMGGMMGGQRGGMGMMMPGPRGTPGAGNPQGMGPGAMPPDAGAMMGRMGMMEQRMNMMQMMMDQMLQQQELMLEGQSDGNN